MDAHLVVRGRSTGDGSELQTAEKSQSDSLVPGTFAGVHGQQPLLLRVIEVNK